MLARQTHPLSQAQERVVLARHQNLDVPFMGEPVTQLLAEGERQVLFLDSTQAFRTAVYAAMAGIDHHRKGSRLAIPRQG